MVVVLPAPLTPTIRMTNGPSCAVISSGNATGSQNSDQGSTQALRQRVDILELLAREAFLQITDNLLGGVDANVGHDE